MIEDYIQESIKTKELLLEDGDLIHSVSTAIDVIYNSLNSGGKLLVCGNGGSAADSQHFAAEFIGKYDKLERRGYPAIALTTDTSALTAWSNDYEFETVFKRQVEALGNEGDVLVTFSTSGNSKNIISAIKEAQNKGMKTISFSGKGGGDGKGLSGVDIIVPSDSTPRVQESHVMLLHILAAEVEKRLVEGEK